MIPRYRQRIAVSPFNIGHPCWEPNPYFDIRNHIRTVRLRRGTETELQAVAGRILSEMMDRNKPLWDLTLIDGLKGGRGAMIARVHHCLVDGVSGVGLFNVLFNPDPVASPNGARSVTPPSPAAGDSLVDAVLSSYSELFDRIVSMESAALNIAETVVEEGVSGFNDLVHSVPELLGSVDRLPFNKPCEGPRKLVWTEVPMSEVKAIRDALGGKLNDVVLTVVTAAIRRYTQRHRQPVRGRMLRVMVPVNMRVRDAIETGDDSHMGNRVSMFPVIVPLDISNPVKLLEAVRQRTETLKGSSISEVVRFAGNFVGFLPAPVQAAIAPHASSLPMIIPPWNMVCTNVPGPKSPLFMIGREMLTSYPYVPIGAEMGLNAAIQSYNGKLFFGFTGSEAAAPDVDIVPRLLDEVFAELHEAAGISRPLRKPAKGKRTVKKAVSPEAPRVTARHFTPHATKSASRGRPVGSDRV